MNPQRQRLLALGLLMLAAGFVWLAILQPVLGAFAAQGDNLDDLKRQLGAYERHVAMKPVVEMRLAALKSHEASSTGLIGGKSAELAAATMQNTMKALIESVQGQVTSAQNLPPVTADGFQRVDIQYQATVPMARLKDITYRIETSMPYLFLDGIDLRAPENWQASAVSTDVPSVPPNIEVHWTVHGYRWVGGP
jgi:hypothetical protein